MKKTFFSTLIFCLTAEFCVSAADNIQVGPWTTGATETSVHIVWTSVEEGTAFVELEDGTVIYESYAGRHAIGRLHDVRLTGLKPGQAVRYRIGGQVLTDGSNPRYPQFSEAYNGEWHSVKTFDSRKKTCRFSMTNDVHDRIGGYEKLAAQIDSAATDFIFLCGDIKSTGNNPLDTLTRYEIEPLGSLAAGLPVMFARGNHEGRGLCIREVEKLYPNEGAAPYFYAFREGPVAFIVFDGGETGTKRSLLYCDKEVYEDYLNEQIEWARKVVKEKWFRSAPIKVSLQHVPMVDMEDKNDYILQRWMNHNIVPVLNKAGVNLMLGADLHEQMLCPAGTMNNKFPIIVNKDLQRLEFFTDGKKITVKSFRPDGTCTLEETF